MQRILRANAWTPQHGSIGRGEASLQGAVYCERCRRRMSTAYRSQRRDGHWSRVYLCIGDLPKGGKQHTGVPGGPLEAVVEREVLARINPVSVTQLQQEWDEAHDAESAKEHHRKLELHRLRAEVADLEYRYLKVDVDNPHVRRMLGGRLEQAERALEQRQTDTQLPSRARVLDADGFRELTALASTVETIFYAPTTANRDCKEIIRTLVERFPSPPLYQVAEFVAPSRSSSSLGTPRGTQTGAGPPQRRPGCGQPSRRVEGAGSTSACSPSTTASRAR